MYTLSKRAIAVWLCLQVSVCAAADKKNLQIELLIFQQRDKQFFNEEQWPQYPGEPNSDAAFSLENRLLEPAHTEQPIQLLPSTQWRLTELEKKLDQQRYRIVQHLAWQQPAYSSKHAVDIALPELPLEPETTMSENDSYAAAPLPHLAELVGTVTVSYSRFPHLQYDILWRNLEQSYREKRPNSAEQADWAHGSPWPAPQPIEEEPISAHSYPSYRLHNTVRLKLDKIHYLDHPLLGLFVLVREAATEQTAVSGTEAASKTRPLNAEQLGYL